MDADFIQCERCGDSFFFQLLTYVKGFLVCKKCGEALINEIETKAIELELERR